MLFRSPPPSTDRSALVSSNSRGGKSFTPQRDSSYIGRDTTNNRPWCDHCNRPGHTCETCWRIHGRPPFPRGHGGGRHGGHSGRGPSRAHLTTESSHSEESPASSSSSSPAVGGLSSADMETLRRIMTQLNTTGASTSFAQTGISANFSHALHADSNQPWIIDSGASDHMTGLSSVFSTYIPSSGKEKVRTADGSLSSISGKGVIKLFDSLPLSSVLHVPNFSTNLLSIARITSDLNCSVTFFPSHCVFQDLSTKKVIGSGREENGLYFLLSGDDTKGNLSTAAHHIQRKTILREAWLWHQRLGHPSFY